MPSCNPCSQISMPLQEQELRNSFMSTDRDLLRKKYEHREREKNGCKEEMLCLQRKSQLLYAEDTKELNPPVCRERLLCQGVGRHTAGGQEGPGSFQELQHLYSLGNGQSGTRFTAASWTPNPTAGWDLGVLSG